MPTKLPRIAVTLKPSTAAALRRMSEVSGNSQSAIVGELLEASEPVFERMVKVMLAAKEAQAGVKDRIRQNLEEAEQVLHQQLGLMLGDLDSRSADLVDELEKVPRRAARGKGPGAPGAVRARPAPPSGGRPPLLTGGSGRPQRTGKTATSSSRRKGKTQRVQR